MASNTDRPCWIETPCICCGSVVHKDDMAECPECELDACEDCRHTSTCCDAAQDLNEEPRCSCGSNAFMIYDHLPDCIERIEWEAIQQLQAVA